MPPDAGPGAFPCPPAPLSMRAGPACSKTRTPLFPVAPRRRLMATQISPGVREGVPHPCRVGSSYRPFFLPRLANTW